MREGSEGLGQEADLKMGARRRGALYGTHQDGDFEFHPAQSWRFFFKLGNGILEFSRDLSGKGVVLKKKPADQIPPTQNYGGYQQSEVPADR